MARKDRYFITLIFLSGLIFICSSCQPLQKKFTRKKKEDKEEKFIPILEPIEYGENSVSVQEKYNHYYQIYRVWEKELTSGFDGQNSDKNLKYSLEQIIINLEEMEKLITVEKKTVINSVLDLYRGSLVYFEKPKSLRNENSLIGQLRRLERDVRKNLKPEIVFEVKR